MKLAKNLERLGTETAFKVLAEAKQLEAKGKEIIHLGLGQPDFKTPKHIVNAAKKSKEMGLKVVTFTGFNRDNSLKNIGDFNFWVDSKAYNIVEMTHKIWLLSFVDSIIGSAEYSAS